MIEIKNELTNEVVMGREIQLVPVYSGQKSFYKKAFTRTDTGPHGVYYSLFSYGTFIMEIKQNRNGERFINATTEYTDHLTNTTLKHLRDFMYQLGLEPLYKADAIKVIKSGLNYAY